MHATHIFLFTDLEGSTRTWERDPSAMAGWLAAHDRFLRETIRGHDGRVFKHTGDGLCAVFDSVAAAVRAARAIQAVVAANREQVGPLRVRVAVHAGDASARDDDFYGPTLNRCARLLGIGHGGQVLLSNATAALLTAGPISDDVGLMDLGEHRLRDLQRAERVWQLVAPDLERMFPTLKSLDAFAHNLPVQRSSFVGRSEEILAVRALLNGTRLVTLIGVGGGGKTRLALEVAVGEVERYPDGVFFADLSDVLESGLVASTIAGGLGVPPGVGTSDERLIQFLADRRVLIVIDNCEQVLDGCARVADRVLGQCRDVSVLATSREPLAIDGEYVWRVPALGIPAVDTVTSAGSVDQVARAESVRLFTDRAAAVRPDFSLTPQNAADVAEICRRLDGIPLAIELAAARIAHLAPREIVERLADRFRLLTSGRRTVPRQQTLHAVLDWSHDLLEDTERILLRRLAVFAGGWTLDAAEGVCGGHGLARDAVIDMLGRLVARSLVVTEDRGDHTRYRMLETVRMYALERLLAAGEAMRTRAEHAAWYLARAERSPDGTDVAGVRSWFGYEPSDLIGDLDNLREATEWWREERRYDAMVRIVAATTRAFQSQGRYDEPDDWLATALAHVEELAPAVQARCFGAWAEAAEIRGQFFVATERARKAVAIAEDPADAGGAYSLLVANLTWSAPEEAEALLEHAREWSKPLGPLADGYVLYARASLACARQNYQEAVRLFSQVTWRDAAVYGIRPLELATAYLLTGSSDRARAIVERITARRDVARWRDYYAPFLRAAIAAVDGANETARAQLAEASTLIRRWKIPLGLADCVLGWAIVRYHAGEVVRASELLGAVGAATGGGLRSPMSLMLYRHYVRAVRETMGREAARRARAIGTELTLDRALARELADAAGLDTPRNT